MDVEKIKNKIKNWPSEDADAYLRCAVAFKTLDKKEEISNNFLAFVKHMWPGFVEGKHHTEIAEKFNKIAIILITISTIVFEYRNIDRVKNEIEIYKYKPILDVFYEIDDSYFDIKMKFMLSISFEKK